MNRSEMRQLLHSDENKVLHDTWYEYSEDEPLPTENRDNLIEAILDLMERDGDIQVSSDTFKLSDLARDLDVNPKVARDKIRKAKEKPKTSVSGGWVFAESDKQAIIEIIKPRRKS